MRLFCSIKSVPQGHRLHELLNREGIDNKLELLTNSDWGSDQYGDHSCTLWIIEEDQFATALTWLRIFEDNPEDPRLDARPMPRLKIDLISETLTAKAKSQPVGSITFYLILICTALFLWENMQFIEEQTSDTTLLRLAKSGAYYSNLWRAMLFEDPTATSFNGIYDPLTSTLKGEPVPVVWDQPIFPDIANGQVWRLFSPALLHSDLFHLFFNMTALLVLGRQMESRLKIARYLLFILLTGIAANLAQYLMSGPNFVGFSGVLVGMIAFVVARQQLAPWEGYQLQKSSLAFAIFFLFAMVGLQVVSFVFEVYWNMPLSPRIANTAHLIGGLAGYLLGRNQLFAWKR